MKFILFIQDCSLAAAGQVYLECQLMEQITRSPTSFLSDQTRRHCFQKQEFTFYLDPPEPELIQLSLFNVNTQGKSIGSIQFILNKKVYTQIQNSLYYTGKQFFTNGAGKVKFYIMSQKNMIQLKKQQDNIILKKWGFREEIEDEEEIHEQIRNIQKELEVLQRQFDQHQENDQNLISAQEQCDQDSFDLQQQLSLLRSLNYNQKQNPFYIKPTILEQQIVECQVLSNNEESRNILKHKITQLFGLITQEKQLRDYIQGKYNFLREKYPDALKFQKELDLLNTSNQELEFHLDRQTQINKKQITPLKATIQQQEQLIEDLEKKIKSYQTEETLESVRNLRFENENLQQLWLQTEGIQKLNDGRPFTKEQVNFLEINPKAMDISDHFKNESFYRREMSLKQQQALYEQQALSWQQRIEEFKIRADQEKAQLRARILKMDRRVNFLV